VATTLVTLSGKEKCSVGPQSSAPSFGLGTDPMMLEPGMSYLLLNFFSGFHISLSLSNIWCVNFVALTHDFVLLCVCRLPSVPGESQAERFATNDAILSFEKGIAACQKGFEPVANEAKASLKEKNLLEEENCKLREENEKLKNQSHQLAS
jgi:hypothetical protein